MGFETTMTPLMTTQIAVYPQWAASFTAKSLEVPIFGNKPRILSLDELVEEPRCHNGALKGWRVYDENHLFQPRLGESLYIGDQKKDLLPHLIGKKYGERFPSTLLPKWLMIRPMPRLEEMKAHILEHGGLHYILESISPAQELLFRRVGSPNWSGFGENHLIVSKKEGEWLAEAQSVPTQTAFVDNVGDGPEDAFFQFRVIHNVSAFWMVNERTIPVYTTNTQAKQLPSVSEIATALHLMPPLLVGGLHSVELIDEEHENGYYGQMVPTGVLRLYRGSRDHHLHATLFHELAHWFTMRILGSVFLAEQAHWLRAMMQDARNPSGYAATNIGEDFAESVALYFLTGGGRFGKAPVYFRNRFALLDQLFHDCFTIQNSRALASPASAGHATFSSVER